MHARAMQSAQPDLASKRPAKRWNWARRAADSAAAAAPPETPPFDPTLDAAQPVRLTLSSLSDELGRRTHIVKFPGALLYVLAPDTTTSVVLVMLL